MWGHQLDEYKEMFDLTDNDLESSILEYKSGITAFNSDLKDRMLKIISADALFNLDKKTLMQQSEIIFNNMIAAVKEDLSHFDFKEYENVDNFIFKRRNGMAKFFQDYDKGRQENRYVNLNYLDNIKDFAFDYALCSHHFFCDPENLDLQSHITEIKMLTRIAKEVRIFPLIDRFEEPASLLGPVLLGLQQENFFVEVKTVPYHLQPEGNAMLRVCMQECKVT